MTHFRLPISDESTHKSVNPQSLTIQNAPNGDVTYDGSNSVTINMALLEVKKADELSTTTTFNVDLTGKSATQYSGTSTTVNVSMSNHLPVKFGGTGLTTIAADALVLGNGTSALKTIAKSTTKGAVLSITDSNTVGYQSITFASTAGTNIGQTIALKVGDTTVNDIDLDLASTTQSGVVSTVAQAFKGTKTFNDGMHIYGTINMAGTSTTTVYSGGAYHGGHNSIVLHGDSAGVSGILFTSQLATDSATVTNVNLPTDRAFIQYHSRGVTPSTADGTAPTLATSGEAGRLVIGIANDAASDMVVIQTGNGNDFRRLKLGSTNLYNVYDASNLTPTFGNWSIPTDNTPPEATLTFGPADSGTLKNRASVTIDLPVADQTHSGIINIVNQSIKGQKTFLDGVHSALFCVEDSSNAHKVQLEYNSTTKALDFNFV